jgi:hypothetical protein
MKHLFVKHLPKAANGMVSYDINAIWEEVPEGFVPRTDEPNISITPSGVTLYFECIQTHTDVPSSQITASVPAAPLR